MLAGVVAIVAVAAVGVLLLGRGDGGGTVERSSDPLRLGSRTIAYVCGRRICVWEGEGRTPRVLTSSSDGADASPVWSPDGSRIAFLHVAGAGRRADLHVMDADGSNRVRVATRLAFNPLILYGPPFAWSPDGARLVVSRVVASPRRAPGPRTKRELFDAAITGPASDLFLVDLASRRAQRLTRSSGFDGLPAWVGSRLAYARLRRNDPRFRSDVRLVDPASGDERVLFRAAGTINLLASAPGVSSVTVATGRHGGPGLTAVDLATGHAEVLVARCCASGLSWAPDGRRLAVSGIDGPLMYIADVATRRLRQTAAKLPCLGPDWSPDGRSVICARPYGEADRAGGGSDLVLVDPATGKRARLTNTASASEARWRPPPVRDA